MNATTPHSAKACGINIFDSPSINPLFLSNLKRISPQKAIGALLAVVTFVTLWIVHGDVMIHPNSHMLSSSGEGARVYYVLASHAKHDSTFLNFQGMNYPYGEHLVYCDAQPAIANSFKALTNIVPELANYAVGFQNSLSLYGFIFAVLLLYVLLLRWKIPAWYSALAALAIVMIGPQISRLPWQPGLAYPFAIPLVLLLLQSYIRTPNWRNTVWICAIQLLLFFINPYLGVMGSGVFLLAGGVLWLKTNWKELKLPVQVAAQALVPGLLYYAFVAATDHRTDRVQIPTGFIDFNAQFNTVFSSNQTPLASIYELLGMSNYDVAMHEEGWAYIGISATVILLFWLFIVIISKVNKMVLDLGIGKEQKLMLVVAIAFLFVGFGLPFSLHESMESLLDIFPPLRQLRAPGRMAWVFTYAINILAFYVLYQYIIKRIAEKHQWKGLTVAVVLLCVTAYEGVHLHLQINRHAVPSNAFDDKQLPTNPEVAYLHEIMEEVDFTEYDYSALVSVPFYHVGSELYVTKSNASFRSVLESMTIAYHTGLPLMNAHLSRISKSESEKSLQFFASPLITRMIEQDLPFDQPILFCFGKKKMKLSAEEKYLLDLGKVVYESDFLLLTRVWPVQMFENSYTTYLHDFERFKDSYQIKDGCYYVKDDNFRHWSFDDLQSDKALAGNALEIKADSFQAFFEEHIHAANLPNGKYELSFWFEHSNNRAQALMKKHTYNRRFLSCIDITEMRRGKATFDFFGNYMRVSVPFEIRDEDFIRLYFEVPRNIEKLYIDEMLVRREGSSIFVEVEEGKWMWNNYPLYEPE